MSVQKILGRLRTIIIIFSFFPMSVMAQLTFERAYGGALDDMGHCVQQTLDGGYIIIGKTLSFGFGRYETVDRYDIYLIKTDAYGDTLWTQTYGGRPDDNGGSVQQTSDGGYIIAGTVGSIFGISNMYLIKTDANGNIIWHKNYGSGALGCQAQMDCGR